MKININDHDGLNAAFYRQIVGGEPMPGNTPHYTRSVDAVLPHWPHQWCSIGGPTFQGDTWVVLIENPEIGPNFRAEAPTLPHAAVVALLRARGVIITEDNT